AQHECEADFAQVARLVDEFADLPMLLIPGNHDVDGRQDGTIPLTIGRRKLAYTRKVDTLDLPGARVIVADTTIPGRGRGTLDRVANPILEQAAGSDRPVFLGMHHQLQKKRLPRYWPAGIGAPRSLAFLDELNRLAQPVTVSSGHTHRNRSRRHGEVLITEVGSTKDWPGVWAGYAVHEGGIRQVIRRVADPYAIDWTEYSRQAVLGLWGHWSPGPLAGRCVSHPWAARSSTMV
ncbi:MAG: metallophosphoesterase family protein, partial [Acidimicrobiales bacterium]